MVCAIIFYLKCWHTCNERQLAPCCISFSTLKDRKQTNKKVLINLQLIRAFAPTLTSSALTQRLTQLIIAPDSFLCHLLFSVGGGNEMSSSARYPGNVKSLPKHITWTVSSQRLEAVRLRQQNWLVITSECWCVRNVLFACLPACRWSWT